jgi:cryptochrome
MPTTMKMIQNLVKEELSCTSADKLDRIPKPKPVPVKLGNLPVGTSVQSIAQSAQAVCPKQRLSIPALDELGYNELPHPLSAEQFPGGESAALKRLHDMVSAVNQKSWVCEFQKPKTSSTNRKAIGKTGGDDWTTPTTSGLSPYLAQGSLSVREVWYAIQKVYDQAPKGKHAQPPESLHGQLLFREMFYVLGYCVDNFHLPEANAMCKDIKWGGGAAVGSNGATLATSEGKTALKAWQEGKTGFPLIDAYMRQLTTTGWMHHLGRHAVACFLTRGDLYLSWVHGRDFFDKHLLDGDWALNNGNWLWLAGVAPFSSPWFRVYSPTPPVTGATSALNAEQSGDFVRFWVPELKAFPTKFIYDPSKAPELAQSTAKCKIGKDHPNAIVQHAVASKANMGAFKKSLDDLSGKRQTSDNTASTTSAKKQKKR